MSDLNTRLNAYIAGDPTLQKQILGSGASLAQAQEYADILSSCISAGLASAGLPFAVGFSVSSPTVVGTNIEFEGNLDVVERPSWGSGGPAELVRLFNNGWDITSEILPFGPWGDTGRMGRARRSRGGLRFVQQIVADYKAKVPANVDVSYDSRYDR